MQIDVWTLAFQIVNFLVLVWLLARLLYRPALQLLEERRRREREVMEKAERLAAEAKAERERFEKAREELLRERQRLREEVLAETEAERRRLLEETRAELARERERFSRELERLRREALSNLREDVAGLLADFARGLVGSLRSPALDEAFFQRLAERLGTGPLPPGGDGVVLRCANPPDPPRERLYRERLQALADGRSIDIRPDPGLLAGVVLEAGTFRASFTLDDVIRDVRERLLPNHAAAS